MLHCVQGQLSSAKAELALEIHKKMKHASSDKRQVLTTASLQSRNDFLSLLSILVVSLITFA